MVTSPILKNVILFFLVLSAPALAAEHEWQPSEVNAAWQGECGSCHMAFPPELLSKSDWQSLMLHLDKHFGADASLEPKVRDEIAAFLERNAGSAWDHSSESQRITETSWFVHKHRSAIRMVQKGRVKSLADCAACHKDYRTEKAL